VAPAAKVKLVRAPSFDTEGLVSAGARHHLCQAAVASRKNVADIVEDADANPIRRMRIRLGRLWVEWRQLDDDVEMTSEDIHVIGLYVLGRRWTRNYFPMQKVERIRFKMSSAVVEPVSSSRARRAL